MLLSNSVFLCWDIDYLVISKENFVILLYYSINYSEFVPRFFSFTTNCFPYKNIMSLFYLLLILVWLFSHCFSLSTLWELKYYFQQVVLGSCWCIRNQDHEMTDLVSSPQERLAEASRATTPWERRRIEKMEEKKTDSTCKQGQR